MRQWDIIKHILSYSLQLIQSLYIYFPFTHTHIHTHIYTHCNVCFSLELPFSIFSCLGVFTAFHADWCSLSQDVWNLERLCQEILQRSLQVSLQPTLTCKQGHNTMQMYSLVFSSCVVCFNATSYTTDWHFVYSLYILQFTLCFFIFLCNIDYLFDSYI